MLNLCNPRARGWKAQMGTVGAVRARAKFFLLVLSAELRKNLILRQLGQWWWVIQKGKAGRLKPRLPFVVGIAWRELFCETYGKILSIFCFMVSAVNGFTM